jgi:GTP-binding protein
MRASGADEAIRLEPPIIMTVEKAIEWINEDEYVEFTPKSIRLRERILDHDERYKSRKKTAVA